jgi:uncharacterized membrane protein (DUF373 family)
MIREIQIEKWKSNRKTIVSLFGFPGVIFELSQIIVFLLIGLRFAL